VAHGGLTYSEPILIDRDVLAALEQLGPLAPLHQPHNIAAIRTMGAIASGVPQVACFDTAFHRSEPLLAQEFALARTDRQRLAALRLSRPLLRIHRVGLTARSRAAGVQSMLASASAGGRPGGRHQRPPRPTPDRVRNPDHEIALCPS
jgi:hypothetical protein